jgi:hypothetical protein
MAIVAPDKIGFTGLGGSSITPRDTYARPAHQEADQTLGALADAASKMGVKFTQIGQEQDANTEDLDRKKVDYYVGLVRKDIKDGGPMDAQVGTILPQQSAAIRAEVARRIGIEHGQAYIAEKTRALYEDPRRVSDPDFMRNSLTQIKKDAVGQYKDDPFYGSGFASGVNGTADSIADANDQDFAKDYMEKGAKAIGEDTLNGVHNAGGVTFKTVADTPDADFTVLKSSLTSDKAGTDSVDHLNVEYAGKLQEMIAGAKAAGVDVKIFSGYRSEEKQAQLYNDKVSKLMEKGQTKEQAMRAARKWVAPPGSSNHNHGEAVDLKYGKGASEWVHANAEKYGLYFPMGHEPWHVEQIGGRRQQGLHGGRPDASDTGEPYEDSGHAENLQSTPGAGYLTSMP